MTKFQMRQVKQENTIKRIKLDALSILLNFVDTLSF